MCFLVAVTQLLAQNKTVIGKVTDEKGVPIANASVVVKGTTKGVTTSVDGSFSLSVPSTAKTLVISSVNFSPVEMSIKGTPILVKLQPENALLEEVVVVGFGIKNVREVTGAVSKVPGEKIFSEPVTSFNQALAGKTAGVQVNLSTGLLADRTAIRVRGVNSISSSSQPLVVVDGIPQLNTTNLNGFNSGNGNRFDPLSLINSADIESIEILKDAGAAVLYGSQASNGVILITTKKGKKGNMKVSFDSKLSQSSATKQFSVLNGDQFIAISNEKAANRYGVSNPAFATPAKESDINGDGINDRTDWVSLLYRKAMMTDNSVSFSGGADKMTVFGSARYLNQEGIVVGNKLRSGQARLNLDITPKTWFKAGISLAYVQTLANGVLSDTYISGTTVSGLQAPPTLSPYDPTKVHGYNLTTAGGLLSLGNNTPVSPTGATLLPGAAYYYNSLAVLNQNRNNNTATDTKISIYGEIQPIKGLKVTTKFSEQYQSNFEDQYTSPYQAGLGLPYGGLVQNQTQNWNTWVWQNYAAFDKTIASNHKIGVVAGAEYQKYNYYYRYTGAGNFSDPFFTTVVDGAYTNTQPGSTAVLDFTGGNNTQNGSISYFGRLNYSFKGKYFVEGAFRRDGFSGFGANNQFGNFPSVSIGWEATKEKFLTGVSWLEYLKVRGSYGTVGNRRGVGDFAARNLYSGAAYTSLTGLAISQQGNAGLKWESSNKLNIGFEANFLKGKLGVVVDYFNTNINNLILSAPTLYTVGVPNSSITTNIGGMTNKGIEVTINATPISTKNFTWTTSLNYTNIKNTVNVLVPSNGNADIISGFQVASVGKSLGLYQLPNWAGVNPANGNPMWYAANGSIKMWDFSTQKWLDDKGNASTALAFADYQYQDKTGLPKWYGGWDNTFKYKNFDLGISITYAGGNYIYNTTKASMLTNFFSNNFTAILNRWTKPGDVTDIPRLYQSDNQANVSSTRFLEKGDYVRVRTITLGYNFQKNLLNKAGIENIRLYVQAFNPFTITKYSGLDPDVNYNSFSNIAIGIDNRATPQVKTITAGLNITF
jgi:TonB-linked SusC/RagA family outer membrane protein